MEYIRNKFRINSVFKDDKSMDENEEVIQNSIHQSTKRILTSRSRKRVTPKVLNRGSKSGINSVANIRVKRRIRANKATKKSKNNVYNISKNIISSRKRAASPYESDSSDNSSKYSDTLSNLKSSSITIPLKSILSRKQLVGRRSGSYGRFFTFSNAKNVHWGVTPVYEESERRLYGIPFHKIMNRKQINNKRFPGNNVQRNNKIRSYSELMRLYNDVEDLTTRKNTVFNTVSLTGPFISDTKYMNQTYSITQAKLPNHLGHKYNTNQMF